MKHNHILIGIGIVLLTLAAFPFRSADADEAPDVSYQFVVIGESAYGDLILDGNYVLAIDRLTNRQPAYKYAVANNLCVAHSMLRNFEAAMIQCDEAIVLARNASKPAPRHKRDIEQVRSKLAQAFSNRGVLRAMAGDESGAEMDFRKAVSLKTDVAAPPQNLAKFSLENAAAGVASTER